MDTEKRQTEGKQRAKNKTPYATFPEVIDYLGKLVKEGGITGAFDSLTKAVGSDSMKSSTFINRIYSMKKFGLIQFDAEKQTYSVEQVGIQIVSLEHLPSERNTALQFSFLKHEIIRKIWEIYKGNILPPRETFATNLGMKMEDIIPKDVRADWANYFYQGAEYSGLLDKRPAGFWLRSAEPKLEDIRETDYSGKNEQENEDAKKNAMLPPRPQKQPTVFISSPDNVDLSKTLPSGKILTLVFPEDLTEEDARNIIKRLNFAIASVSSVEKITENASDD